MRSIRIDDFPHGDRAAFNPETYKEEIKPVLEILEEFEMDYFLGASPFLFDIQGVKDVDVKFLNENVIKGHVVMHGFNHGWWVDDWSKVVETWPAGGEFCESEREILELDYVTCDARLDAVTKYDKSKFIAPFNCFTQSLVEVLDKYKVKELHTCDKEFFGFGFDKFDYNYVMPVISRYHVFYDYAEEVLKRLVANPSEKSQITLHWIYDIQRSNWKDSYRELCRVIKDGI